MNCKKRRESITHERMAALDQMIADLKRIIESVASNAAAGTNFFAQDTESPVVVRTRSSVASQPG
jgi:hypothetical protein